MKKLDGKSLDIKEQNIEQLKELFPEVFSEGKINLEKLQEELGNFSDKENERYNFTWNGKQNAKKIAQTPSTGTLRPCKEESKDWDTTQNLYIEGDNLEVLKLLQKSYHKKVKMIYIDPPYNTGKDFVYKDNFKDNIKNYLEITNQVDSEGNKLSVNADTNGRYHSDWLSMMYPRLKLARNLLKDDGVICISIDDNEITNLKKITDEIFGEDNLILQFITVSNPRGRQTTKLPFALTHEYILVFAKNINQVSLNFMDLTDAQRKEYNLSDASGSYRLIGLRKRGAASDRKDRPNLFYPIYYNIEENIISTTKIENSIEIFPRKENRSDGVWRWQKSKVEEDKDKLFVKIVNRKSGEKEYDIFVKDYLNTNGEEKGAKYKSILDNKDFNNEKGTVAVKNLFDGQKVFDFPKPVELIKTLINFSSKNGLILDFFAGSGTTAQAVEEINLEDGGHRNFICIQIPEKLEEKVIVNDVEYSNISDITKERIRRAGDKIRADNPDKDLSNLDIGFKVFKLDSSNIKEWDSDFENLEQNLIDATENIKEDRSSQDLLYEILLKYGLDLTLPIEEMEIENKTVYNIGFGALVVCLDDEVTINVVQKIAEFIKEQVIYDEEKNKRHSRVVFKDGSFKDSVVKTNALQVLKQVDIDEVVSV